MKLKLTINLIKMINLIACVTIFKNRLAIGKNNDLLFKLKDDMKFFKNITSFNLSSTSKLNKNIVLMGRKTWFSIPQQFRPLNNRINLILTNDRQLLSPIPKNLDLNGSDFYLEALNTEPDHIMPSSSDDSIHYQYGSS